MKLSLKISALLLISQLSFASVFSVLKASGSSLDELLTRGGVLDSEVRNVVTRNLDLAMKDLSPTGKKADFKLSDLEKLVSEPADKRKFSYIKRTFEKDTASGTELSTAIKDFVYLSQRYGVGKSAILSCSSCVNKKMADYGFEYVLTELKDTTSSRIFNKMSRYNTPTKMKRQLNKEVKGKWSRRVPSNLSATDEEALLYFFTAQKMGSQTQKELISAVEAVSKVGGKTDLFSNKNGHKFYTFLSSGFSNSEMKELTRVLKKTAKEMESSNSGTMDAFYDVLQKEAEGARTPAQRNKKLALIEYLSSGDKNCFKK